MKRNATMLNYVALLADLLTLRLPRADRFLDGLSEYRLQAEAGKTLMAFHWIC